MILVEKSIVIHRPRAAVYRFLRGPGNIASLQPFVVGLELEGKEAPSAGAPYRYRAIEIIPVARGFFRLRNVLHVEQINDDAGERFVRSSVRVEGPVPAPLGRLLSLSAVQTMSLSEGAEESTRVTDRFELHTYPRLLRRFVEATANEAHQAILARLKERLEATAAEPLDRSALDHLR